MPQIGGAFSGGLNIEMEPGRWRVTVFETEGTAWAKALGQEGVLSCWRDRTKSRGVAAQYWRTFMMHMAHLEIPYLQHPHNSHTIL